MSTIHFLNVKQGDCTWIKHNSTRITVIDVNNAKNIQTKEKLTEICEMVEYKAIKGNFNQKDYPVNPIEYLTNFGVSNIFRFILTHPDMDHMGGIKEFFDAFNITNFWDTDNNKEMGSFSGSPYSEDDWNFYKNLRSGTSDISTRCTYYAGAKAMYFNKNENGQSGGDGLYILSPTEALVTEANNKGNYNDCSYVILYRTGTGKKIIFGGDSDDKTWEHILTNYKEDVSNIDILFAPHHGRDSERSYEFLDILKPKMTYFGNAKCEHLAYSAWNRRGLPKITNNQANCIITDIVGNTINIYATYETFAKSYNQNTYYEDNFKAWFLCQI
ncbi:ComEC/Rec2 family competence protein [Clostridium butyricum]|uniref:ComEC/Rec2 family competence protein n=1 Tax=Clostridium butyricum TaxID=1492 RepID=UPI00374F3023